MVKQVMVGSKRYDIRQDSIVLLGGEQVGAKFDGETSTIVIAETLGDGAKPHALMHEIIHSILFDNEYYNENENEKLVNDLAQQFILLIRQNPGLVHYIQSTGVVINPGIELDENHLPLIGDANISTN